MATRKYEKRIKDQVQDLLNSRGLEILLWRTVYDTQKHNEIIVITIQLLLKKYLVYGDGGHVHKKNQCVGVDFLRGWQLTTNIKLVTHQNQSQILLICILIFNMYFKPCIVFKI
jgi:hypothetical protein